MDDEILARREEELEALQAFYGNDLMSSLVAAQGDSTTTADNGTISPNGPWFIKLISSDNNDGGGGGVESSATSTANNKMVPTLEIQLSPHYPLSSDQHDTPIPILHNTHGYYQPASSSEQKKQSLLQELMEMYEPDMDVAIMWAERCRQDFLDVITVAPLVDTATTTNSNNNNNNDVGTTENEEEEDAAYCNKQYTQTPSSNTKQSPPINETLSIMFLTYNHLLCGKSHKKEAQLVSYASKLGFHGFVVYGTPGVVGLLVSSTSSTTPTSTTTAATTTTRDDVVDFAKECGKSIGKRATLLDFELQLCNDGLHPSLCMVGDGSSGGGNGGGGGGGKQSSKTKGNSSTNKKGNKDGSTTLSKQNSKSKQKGNIGSLLSDLLGADRITGGGNDLTSLSILKAGLNSFSTCVELKQILVSHGLEEDMFQQILGLA